MSVGKIGAFELGKDDWELYIDRLEQYFVANDIKETLKVATLITAIGNEAYELMANLCTPDKPATKKYEELVQVMKNHLQPKPSILAERFKFRQRTQQRNEMVADYVAALKNLVKNCRFTATSLNENLRDQFVCGIQNENIRQRLFTEDEIAFDKAYKIAVTMEAAEKDAAQVQAQPGRREETLAAADVHQLASPAHGGRRTAAVGVRNGGQRSTPNNVQKGPSAASDGRRAVRCMACGGAHSTHVCKFKVYVCRVCNKEGHLKKVCPNMKKGAAVSAFHVTADEQGDVDSGESDEVNQFTMTSNKFKGFPPYRINILINEINVDMEIDTGSSVSCISLDLYNRCFSNCVIEESDLNLRYYTGEMVKPVGKMTPFVKYRNKCKELDLYVVDKGKTSLVGRQWLKELEIQLPNENCNKNIVCDTKKVFDLSAFSSRYCEVFEDGLGKFTGGTVGFRVREGATPVFLRARPLAYALREPVERELDRLLADGVITPVSSSDWATPIVPVMKKDGSIRVWFRGVRSSKFRHVYGVPSKRERCYDNIKITRNAHDSNFCAVNPKFVAIVTEVAGGGAFLVLPLDHTGRLDFNASRVTGHKGPVLDIKWNPFNDNIIASCSDDCTVKLWHIPDGGLSMHLTDWLVELHGHKRRVAYIEWHPTAENILLSAGFDYLIFVWDVGKGEAVKVIDCHSDVIYCMSFNRDGSLLATTCKDKKLRVIEPRSGIVLSEGPCHLGTKASKCTFLGSQGKVLTTGFSRHSDRQYAVWDQHSLERPLACETIDSSSGVVFPYYDHDTNMVYLAGKGDGNIRYYEVVDEPPYVHFLNQFLSGNPQRGLGFMPKRGVNTAACEVFRFYKLHTSRGLCEPIAMIVPRKSDCFQEDLYPDTAAPLPALSAKDWLSGMNAPPLLISMKTGVTISTHKPRTTSKDAPALQPQDANNRKKFAFLSRETTPDYRPLGTWQEINGDDSQIQLIEKSQKTSANQNTKFHQLQKMFGKQSGDAEPVPLYKQINQGDVFSTEHELRLAFNRQGEELRIVKRQLHNSQQRVRELEQHIAALQSHIQRESS